MTTTVVYTFADLIQALQTDPSGSYALSSSALNH
jgi:hypothetical protein